MLEIATQVVHIHPVPRAPACTIAQQPIEDSEQSVRAARNTRQNALEQCGA